MNMDDVDKIINYLMDGEDLDDDVKIRVYTTSSEIKNKPNKDFHPFGNVKVDKAIYRPEAQKANHEVNNQLNGSYKDLATVKEGVNAVKQILDQAMIVLNDLEEKLKNV